MFTHDDVKHAQCTDFSINKPKSVSRLHFIFTLTHKKIQLKVDYLNNCIAEQTSEVLVVCDCTRLLSPSQLQLLLICSKLLWLKDRSAELFSDIKQLSDH